MDARPLDRHPSPFSSYAGCLSDAHDLVLHVSKPWLRGAERLQRESQGWHRPPFWATVAGGRRPGRPGGCLALPWDERTHTHFLDLAHSFFQFFTKTGTTCSDVSSLFRDQRSVLSSGWR